jgi:argininosuccinate lyase
MTRLWAGRFGEPPDPEIFRFQASFGFDRRLLEDDIAGSIAWTEALARAGVLGADEARTILVGLDQIRQHVQADPQSLEGADEDVHTFVERRLVELVGEPGRRLHTGRSRNEQVSLDLRLYLRRRIGAIQGALRDLVAALARQAAAAGGALMPAYTHGRRAQPVLVAHYWLAHAAALRRAYDRFAWASREADALPLGSGAVAGTNYAVDTAWLAARLGFSRVVPNSLDAASDRDFVAAFLFGCALTLVHLSRLAEDLILFTGDECGFFELADRAATGSSLLPQKKNPDALELVRGKAGRLIGRLAGWLATMKGLPSGYNKDLQEDKEAVFDAEDTVLACLGALRAVVSHLTVRPERTAAAAGGWLVATEVADYLVARGVPFRQAHEIVGRIVRRLVAEGRDFGSLSLAEWRTFSEAFDEDIRAHLSPQAAVEAKRTPQSTRPEAVAAALAELEAWVQATGG